jgi:hypothetical protein
MLRTIKLGRKSAGVLAKHWAIKVGDTWYELAGKGANVGNGDGDSDVPNVVIQGKGLAAPSGAGSLGGQIVGETTKSDDDINKFITEWLARNPDYGVLDDNCQKFAYEFVVFLTGGANFRLPHRFDAALAANAVAPGGFAINDSDSGIAIARIGTGETSIESKLVLYCCVKKSGFHAESTLL